ncbi:MAG TPA: sulfatase-like hydrolase/transferase [Polyangiaceae bacterium]|nr:sulfatase-like hydrolase/transferase [Polyangiaceae bacterium]
MSLAPTKDGASAAQWLAAAGASFFVAATTGITLGALMGPPLGFLAAGRVRTLRTRLEKLRDVDLEARRTLAAGAFAAATLVSVWGWTAYNVVFDVELELARPESIAEAITVSHLVLALTLAMAWQPVAGLGRKLFDRASSLPGVRRLASRAWGVPAALVLVALVAAAGPAWAHRAEIADLPWRAAVPLPAAMVFIVLSRRLTDPARPGRDRARRVLQAAIGAGLVLSGVAAWQLKPESTTVRKLAFERALSGRIGYAAWTAAFDFDRDGQLSFLGGGDCAPFDSRRHTGAVDVPGNGIDEDCDGRDQALIAIRPRGRIPIARAAVPDRPSIVLVTIDALAAPRLRAVGGGTPLMPHLDEVAQGSMLFTHCFSQGPSTRLSFPSIFTSRWDSQLAQVYGPRHPYSLAPSERQLQDALDEEGYETVAILPSAYFGPSRWPSLTRGFQHVDTSAVGAGKFNAPQVTDAALRALSAAGEEPLYLWVHYYDAHGPYAPPPDYGKGPRNEEALYSAALTFIDRQLERLFAAIDARPDPVLLIVTADHATVFHPDPSKRRGHYGNDLYTATLHVPLIVRGPGIAPGHVDDPVSTMDIAATISDLLHIKDRTELQGTSLLPELLAGRHDPGRALFHELFLYERELHGSDPLEIVSVREGRFNLVLDRVHGTYELYDWRADYFEQHDLYEDQATSPVSVHLRSLLGSFVQQFDRHVPARTPYARAPGSNTARANVAGGENAAADER